jgi:hypothetical protein
MRVSTAFVLLSSANLVQGFSPIATPTSARNSFSSLNAEKQQIESFDPLNLSSQEDNINGDFNDNLKTGMLPLVTLLALTPEAANAAPSPDWGLFEGKTGSLLHPVIMGSMFALSLSTALKGFQYRRQRTMGAEIKALKQTLPSLNGASNLSAAIASAQAAEEVDSAMIAKLQSAMPIENEINALLAERKELSSKGLRDGHFSQGAILAFLGTAFAIEVCTNFSMLCVLSLLFLSYGEKLYGKFLFPCDVSFRYFHVKFSCGIVI